MHQVKQQHVVLSLSSLMFLLCSFAGGKNVAMYLFLEIKMLQLLRGIRQVSSGISALLVLILPGTVSLLNSVEIQSIFEVDLSGSLFCSAKFNMLNQVPFVHLLSVGSTGNIDETLQQCFQCQDTVSLYRLVLRSIQQSLCSDKEKGLLREVSGE